jgi:hypothetical protein
VRLAPENPRWVIAGSAASWASSASASRRRASAVYSPNGAWVSQQARHLGLDLSARGVRLLIRDRDSNYSGPFDEVFRSEGNPDREDPGASTEGERRRGALRPHRARRVPRTGCSSSTGVTSSACSASTSTTTTASGRIARSNPGRPSRRHTQDQRLARSTVATGSAASSTSTTKQPPETRHEYGALHAQSR